MWKVPDIGLLYFALIEENNEIYIRISSIKSEIRNRTLKFRRNTGLKFIYVKAKVIPQQAEVAQGVPGGLRRRIFLTFGTTLLSKLFINYLVQLLYSHLYYSFIFYTD